MSRVKRGVAGRRRHKKIIELTRGHKGTAPPPVPPRQRVSDPRDGLLDARPLRPQR